MTTGRAVARRGRKPHAESGRQLRFLILENVVADAKLCEKELKRAGLRFALRQVGTLAEFEAELDRLAPDVVLSDFTFPNGCDGMAALELAQRKRPDIPFLFVSGTIGEERAAEAVRHGAADYVLKGQLDRLGPIVKRILEKNQRSIQADPAVTANREATRAQARLAAIIEQSADAIISRGLDRKIQTWNPAAERLFGWKQAEAIGQSILFIVPPERRGENTEHRRQVEQGLPVPNYDTVRLAKDGRHVEVSLSQSPIRNERGEVVAVSLIFRDITERTLSARHFEMEHAISRLLAESGTMDAAMPALISTLCEAMNWAYGARWAWSESEQRLCRCEFWSDFEPEFELEDRDYWMRLGAGGVGGLVRRAWLAGEATWRTDLLEDSSFRRGPSCRKFGLRSAYCFPILSGASVIGVMEFFGRNAPEPDERQLRVTESIGRQIGQFIKRREAEVALQAGEARFRSLTNLSSDWYWEMDSEMRLTSISDGIRIKTGLDTSAYIGTRTWDRPALNLTEANWGRHRAQLERREPYRDFELQRERNDGNIVWISISGEPVFDAEGNFRGYRGTGHDITERKRAEEDRDRLAAIVENSSDAIISRSLDRKILTWNAAAERLFGWAAAEVVGQNISIFIPPERAEESNRNQALVQSDRSVPPYDTVRVTKDGRRIDVSLAHSPIKNERGETTAVAIIFRDIAERKLQEQKIEKLMRVRAVSTEINAAIVRTRDRQGLFDEACRIAVEAGNFTFAWVGVVERDPMQLRPEAWAGVEDPILSDRQSPRPLEEREPGGPGPFSEAVFQKKIAIVNDVQSAPRISRKQDHLARNINSIAVLPLLVGGEAFGVLGLHARETGFFDEEEVKLLSELADNIAFALQNIDQQERLDYLSYYDALTGLPNRALFVDRAGQQMRARSGEQLAVALILLNIERFRYINESLGRHAGDDLLKQVAQRLETAFRGKDYLARIGADSFGVVVRGIRDASAVVHTVEDLTLGCFRQPYRLGGEELRVAGRAGIALFPADGADADALFGNAEAALKKARDSGEHYLFYSADMNARAAHVLSLETRLRKAIEEQQFVLHYQPKIELAGDRVCGLEALIRWQEPGGELVAPGNFIPLLEETGLILEVGKWALGRALADHREWTERGVKVPRIAVNVSAIQLQQRDFPDMVINTIHEQGGNPGALELEVTESLLMKDVAASIRKLSLLSGLGVHIAMDDFGTGYSSLAYIARLPINLVKIDRSFISGLGNSPQDMAIVTTIIALAHSLNLKVVAEGVETDGQSKLLKLLKCDEAQGYLFSKPLPAAEIEPLLRAAS